VGRALSRARASRGADDESPAVALVVHEVRQGSAVRVMVMETLRQYSARYVRKVVERHRWNKKRAAKELGIAYHTLSKYLAMTEGPELPAAESPDALDVLRQAQS
jgi:transcriptional regulator with AAA-type ATPase domain